MILKRGASACSLICVFLLFSAGRLAAQMNPIYRFKKVTIPVDLRINDAVLLKGVYDLEFLRANPLSYYLRIMKKGKILKLVQGREFLYDRDSAIPRKPTLNMSKNKAEKLLTLIFESGTDTKIYERVRASYAMAYEGD